MKPRQMTSAAAKNTHRSRPGKEQLNLHPQGFGHGKIGRIVIPYRAEAGSSVRKYGNR